MRKNPVSIHLCNEIVFFLFSVRQYQVFLLTLLDQHRPIDHLMVDFFPFCFSFFFYFTFTINWSSFFFLNVRKLSRATIRCYSHLELRAWVLGKMTVNSERNFQIADFLWPKQSSFEEGNLCKNITSVFLFHDISFILL